MPRGGFGGERYERSDFQQQVAKQFELLRDESWKVAAHPSTAHARPAPPTVTHAALQDVDASRSIADVHEDVASIAFSTIESLNQSAVAELWK